MSPVLLTAVLLGALSAAASCATVEESSARPQECSPPDRSSADTEDTPTNGGEASVLWAPSIPELDQDDWVRLTSGEWLKGEILRLRQREMAFDSDKLDELEIDWEDVAEIHSNRVFTVVFEDRKLATGRLLIRDGDVIVASEEEQRFSRDDLISIVPGEPQERNYWSGELSAGISFRSGNTNQTDTNIRGTLWRRTPMTRLTLDYTGNLGTLEGEENVNNHRVVEKFDVFLSRRFFVTPSFLEYFRDRFANVEHRLTPGVGLGYFIVDEPDVEWEVDLLGGYRYTEFSSVEAGQSRTEDTSTIIAATSFEVEIMNDVDLELKYRVDVGVDQPNDTNHHGEATLSVELTRLLDLDVSFIWDRVGNPERDSGGDKPKKDDFRLVVGLGVEF